MTLMLSNEDESKKTGAFLLFGRSKRPDPHFAADPAHRHYWGPHVNRRHV
jgi:hypothetical protein